MVMGLSIKGTSDQIADVLRFEIESGDLLPGSSLNQVQLADRFNLSRIPIREALRRLEAEGYLTYRPNKGAVIADTPNASELREIIEVREAVETRLMEHAIGNVDEELLARATEAMNAMNRARDEVSLRGSHEHFHSVLFSAANRPLMANVINAWRLRLRFDHQQAFLRRTRAVHKRLLTALRISDVEVVTACVREEYALITKAVAGGQ